jgi:uncharacterized protein (AIM24 family)
MESIERVFKNSQIIGTGGNQYLKFKLHKDDLVVCQLGSLICMNKFVDKAEIQWNGFLKGFQKILAGEPLYYQAFKGLGTNGFICIGTNLLNSIIVIKIKKGETFRLSRNSFLASTMNIRISFTFQMKGLFEIGQEEGFFLPTAYCKEGDYGYIWLSSYGNFEKIIIPKDDYLIVDNGTFLACNNKYQYSLTKLGKTFITSFLNNEGFGMKFEGPVEIFIQTKNANSLLTSPPPVEEAPEIDLLENVGDFIDILGDN